MLGRKGSAPVAPSPFVGMPLDALGVHWTRTARAGHVALELQDAVVVFLMSTRAAGLFLSPHAHAPPWKARVAASWTPPRTPAIVATPGADSPLLPFKWS